MSFKERLFSISELETDKTPKWYHKGKHHTYEELRVCLNREKQLRQSSDTRKDGRRVLKRSFEQLQNNLTESVALRAKGIAATPEFQLLQTQKTTIKPRQVSVHEWNLDKWAGRLGQLDKDKRRPSVQVNSFSQVSSFAVPDTQNHEEDAMDMDWNKVVIEVDDAKFEMPTIQDFNATPQDNLESTLKSMSLDLLKDHLKAERPKTGVGADQPKWNALVNAISEKHQSGGKKHSNGNNNDQRNNSNGSNNSNNSNNQNSDNSNGSKKNHNKNKPNNNQGRHHNNNPKNFNNGNNNNRNNNFNNGDNNNNNQNNQQSHNQNKKKKKRSNSAKPTHEQLQANRKQGHANLKKELNHNWGKK